MCCCRQMQQQLEEAVTLGEGTAAARRAAEFRAALAEARAEAAEAAAARRDGAGDARAALELKNARVELAEQEAAVREARELKGYVRCAAHCAAACIKSISAAVVSPCMLSMTFGGER